MKNIFADLNLPSYLENFLIGGIAILLGLLVKVIISYTFKGVAKLWPGFLINSIIKRLAGPVTTLSLIHI